MSPTNKTKRLQQIKDILLEHDLTGTGLSRRVIAEKILLRFPETGELKSVENTVQNYLSTWKGTEFLNTRRGFWSLKFPSGLSSDLPTPSEGDEPDSTSLNDLSTRLHLDASPSSEAFPGTSDNSAHPRTQTPPSSDRSVPEAHRTDEITASSPPTFPYDSMAPSNYSPLYLSSGQGNLVGAGSSTWPDPAISQRLTTSPYYLHPSLLSCFSNADANRVPGVLDIPSPSEIRHVTIPRSFISATAPGSSCRPLEEQAAFPASSSSVPFVTQNHRPASDLQSQSTHPVLQGYCPTCAQPLYGNIPFSVFIQNESREFTGNSNHEQTHLM